MMTESALSISLENSGSYTKIEVPSDDDALVCDIYAGAIATGHEVVVYRNPNAYHACPTTITVAPPLEGEHPVQDLIMAGHEHSRPAWASEI